MKISMLKSATLVLALATFFFSSCEKETFEPTIDPPVILNPTTQIDQKIDNAVLAEDYQDLFELRNRDGYRPVFIDGFLHRAGVAVDQQNVTMFNVIFEKAPAGLKWAAYHGLTAAAYQSKFNEMTDAGYRPEFVESYPYQNGIRYAVIFVKEAGPAYAAVHGLPIASWQAYFDGKVDAGYRLVNRSVVFVGGNKFVTALFDKKNVGSWISKSNMDLPATQTAMEANKDAGRMLTHLDVAQETTTNFTFAAVFNSEPNDGWYALNNLDEAELLSKIATAKSNGYATTLVSAYDVAGLVNGNEVNHIRYAVGFRK
ncbi:MAG: hypothetical protein KDC54_06300 [Lewinella sp.]|nr:hypothetical protein [Lewinella sp.]